MVTKKQNKPTPVYVPLIFYFPYSHEYVLNMAARGEFSFFFPVRRGRTIQEGHVASSGPRKGQWVWLERQLVDDEFMMLDIFECPELADWYHEGCPAFMDEPMNFVFWSKHGVARYKPDLDQFAHPQLPPAHRLYIDPAERHPRAPLPAFTPIEDTEAVEPAIYVDMSMPKPSPMPAPEPDATPPSDAPAEDAPQPSPEPPTAPATDEQAADPPVDEPENPRLIFGVHS